MRRSEFKMMPEPNLKDRVVTALVATLVRSFFPAISK